MALLRKSTLNQLKRINREIKKQGYQSDKNIKTNNINNLLYIHDPIDSDIKGVRKIVTYEDFSTIDIPNNFDMVDENKIIKINGFEYFYNNDKLYLDKTMKNEIDIYKQLTPNERKQLRDQLVYIKEEKNIKITKPLQTAIEEWFAGDLIKINEIIKLTNLSIDKIKNILDKSKNNIEAMNNFSTYIFEKKKEKNLLINEPINQINNWHSEKQPSNEFNINLIGKFIETDKIKGYVQRIEGNKIFINLINEPFGTKEFDIKDILKSYKINKNIIKFSDFSITGPNKI